MGLLSNLFSGSSSGSSTTTTVQSKVFGYGSTDCSGAQAYSKTYDRTIGTDDAKAACNTAGVESYKSSGATAWSCTPCKQTVLTGYRDSSCQVATNQSETISGAFDESAGDYAAICVQNTTEYFKAAPSGAAGTFGGSQLSCVKCPTILASSSDQVASNYMFYNNSSGKAFPSVEDLKVLSEFPLLWP
eukprot:tig00020801_g13903.t1